MKRWIFIAGALILLLSAALYALDLPLASLVSLRKVDEFPLYSMTYRSDYGFLEETGIDQPPLREIGTRQSESDFACAVFFARTPQGETLLGRNFDWKHKPTMLLYTDPPDGFASVSMVDIAYLGFEPGELTLEDLRNLKRAPFWPFDGMNERGVAIGMMAVPDKPGLRDPAKPTLDSLAVIRLVLDYAGNLEEALELIQSVNIQFGSGPWLHYLVADRHNSAVVEILPDRMNVIRNQQPWQVATNFLLSDLSEAEADSACPRYQTASNELEAAQGVIDSVEAMELLGAISQDNTVWSVVYNLSTTEIRVAMGRDYDDAHNFKMTNHLKEIK